MGKDDKMKITKTALKKMILEVLEEGEVIRGPWSGTPSPNPDLINFVNGLEEVLGQKLEDLHGQQPIDIPIDKLEQLEVVMTEIGRLLDLPEYN